MQDIGEIGLWNESHVKMASMNYGGAIPSIERPDFGPQVYPLVARTRADVARQTQGPRMEGLNIRLPVPKQPYSARDL
jgi:hypothetical protein